MIDVRNSLRVVRLGEEVAEEAIPNAIASGVPEVPLGAHASTTLGVAAAQSRFRRWVDDGRSCIAIIGECAIAGIEKSSIEEL